MKYSQLKIPEDLKCMKLIEQEIDEFKKEALSFPPLIVEGRKRENNLREYGKKYKKHN